MLALKNGEYLATGFVQTGSTSFKGRMVRFTEDGIVRWDSSYSVKGYDEVGFERTIEDKDGNLVTIGLIENDTTGKDHGWLLKTDSLGRVIWSREIKREGHNDHQYLRDIEQTPDGGYLLVGSIFNQPNDAWVVKVDSLGCRVAGCDTIRTAISPVPVPEDFYMGDPVPNPTTGMTIIPFELPIGTQGVFRIVDMHGRVWKEVILVEENGQIELNLSNLPKVITFCSLETEYWPGITRAIVIQ